MPDLFPEPTAEELRERQMERIKNLIFCSKCRYHQHSFSGPEFDKCKIANIKFRKTHLKSWIERSYDYCSYKNGRNDCSDFVLKQSLFSRILRVLKPGSKVQTNGQQQ
jgi:hypothetical protein